MANAVHPQRYMSGPKADAILARAGDPTKKKRKKRTDEPVGSGTGLVLRDEDVGLGIKGDDEDDGENPCPSVVCLRRRC